MPLVYLKIDFYKYHDEDHNVCNIELDLTELVWRDVNMINLESFF